MSRVIKFRAWVKSGDYSEMLPNVQNHIGAATGFGHLLQGTAKGIDESYVMQFTGLHDVNGVEIYEGDIVKVAGGRIYIVVFDEEFAAFMYQRPGYRNLKKFITEVGAAINGNIYENPELLKCE